MYCDYRIRESKMLENTVNSPVKNVLSSSQRSKRKSVNQSTDENDENINCENISVNHEEISITDSSNAVKKPKDSTDNFVFAVPTKKPASSIPHKSIKSSLPRFQTTRSRSNSAHSQASVASSHASSIAASSTMTGSSNHATFSLSNPSTMSTSSTPYSTSTSSVYSPVKLSQSLNDGTSPRKMKNKPISPRKNVTASTPSTHHLTSNNGLMKRLKEVSVQTSSEGILKGLFEKATSNGSTNANDIATLLTIKTKSKWDIKDKVKKQEVAIKECKELIFNHFNDLNELKIACLNHDARVNAILNDCIEAITEKDEEIETLSQTHKEINSKLFETSALYQDIEKNTRH